MAFEKRKTLKKRVKRKMSVLWHPKRWWDLCLPENETKEIEPTFTDKVEGF